jgi:hypothetical protein
VHGRSERLRPGSMRRQFLEWRCQLTELSFSSLRNGSVTNLSNSETKPDILSLCPRRGAHKHKYLIRKMKYEDEVVYLRRRREALYLFNLKREKKKQISVAMRFLEIPGYVTYPLTSEPFSAQSIINILGSVPPLSVFLHFQ